MNWMGNFEIGCHIVKVYVTSKSVKDWIVNKEQYLALAGKVLDSAPITRPDCRADGDIVYLHDLTLRAYRRGDVGVVYYTTPRTSRKGLYIVQCDYRGVVLPQGIIIAEQTAGDGYL